MHTYDPNLTTDKEVFIRIIERMKYEVGEILELINKDSRNQGRVYTWCPWWSLPRIIFPIAEAIGDLLHGKGSNSNLVLIFKDLSRYDSRYAMVANLIPFLYRHSLVHQDEMRRIKIDDFEVICAMGTGRIYNQEHLVVSRHEKTLRIFLDIPTFYEHLLRLCQDEAEKDHFGRVLKKYHEWSLFDLNDKLQLDRKLLKRNKILRQEIENLKTL